MGEWAWKLELPFLCGAQDCNQIEAFPMLWDSVLAGAQDLPPDRIIPTAKQREDTLAQIFEPGPHCINKCSMSIGVLVNPPGPWPGAF